MEQEITEKIMGNTEAKIIARGPEYSLEDPVHAINWFDTRSLFLYNIYNLLASRSVFKVKGKPIVKGRISKTLHGEVNSRRDVLLIVSYPSPLNFLKMLKSTYFQLVSILRLFAVRNFTFSFTHPTTEVNAQPDPKKSKAYLIHHFNGPDISTEIVKLTKEHDINILYSGKLSSRVGTGTKDQIKMIPCLLDGLVVLQAEDEKILEHFAARDDYKQIINQTESSYVGLFKRIL